MARPFPLAALLAVRERKEEAEERQLAQIARELAEARETLQRTDADLLVTADRRAAEVRLVLPGQHHHASYARYKLLVEARTTLLAAIEALASKKLEQQAAYVAARAAREMLTELKATQQRALQAAGDRRDQKRLDDLFTARLSRR